MKNAIVIASFCYDCVEIETQIEDDLEYNIFSSSEEDLIFFVYDKDDYDQNKHHEKNQQFHDKIDMIYYTDRFVDKTDEEKQSLLSEFEQSIHSELFSKYQL